MSTQSRSQSARTSTRAPTDAAPPPIANATVQAVNKLGAITSDEVEKTADEIMRGAAEIAERLGQLADAIRYHSQVASEEVADFCGRATSVFEAIIQLQDILIPGKAKDEAADIGDTPLPPIFTRNSPAEPSEREL